LPNHKMHTPEFESCIEDVMKQGHEKGSAFAICTKSFQDAGKPIYVGESETQKLHLFSESIKLEGNRVSGVAIHPKRIFHPEEGVTHVYLREELKLAAPTLVGKPFGIDHLYILPPPNVVITSWYDPKENGVAFEGVVDDKIAEQIRNKAFKGLSIELDWLRPGGKVEYVDGVAPRNFELTSVHLLKRFPPGDKDAFLKLWNSIQEQLVMGPALPLDQRVEGLERQIRDIQNQIAVINGKLEVMTPKMMMKEEITNMKEEDLKKLIKITIKDALKEAEWDTEYINSLPDSAFAVISKGGEKDEQGKTVPRTLRSLPHHKSDGSLDLPHLRNALARLTQTDLTREEQAEAKRHLCAHAKESQIVSAVCGEEQPKPGESEELVALRRRIVETEAELSRVQKERLEQAFWREKSQKLCEGIKNTIPPSHIWKAWSPGPQKLIQAQLKLLRELSTSES